MAITAGLLPHLLVLIFLTSSTAAAPGGGKWDLLLSNIGISAMHMQLLNNDRVVILDHTDFGASNISLPNNRCRNNSRDQTLKIDCTAHTVEYDVASNSIRPLYVFTDTWCSSGAVMPDGSLMQTGGFNDGDRTVRVIEPCNDGSCDWQESNNSVLTKSRWYSTNHILPDGRQIIVGGRGQFTYEFYPKRAGADQSYNLPFLSQTNDPRIENNLYPFVFLNVDGNIFIFSNNRAILFDYINGVVVRNYPAIPGGDPRNYPSSGSAVLLPLQLGGANVTADVLVCGGAPKGSFTSANNRRFVRALNTCGRIRITDPNPQWVVETMPLARVMGDMVLLPNGNIFIVSGGSSGTAGWDLGRDPVLTPIIYRPNNPELKFEAQNSSSIPRMYHSTAVLLRDGRVLISGSNPHAYYSFTGVLFPTDLSIETYSPDYLDPRLARVKPQIVSPASHSQIGYGQELNITFTSQGRINRDFIKVTMVAPPFSTHAFSMNQRMLVLNNGDDSSGVVTSLGKTGYQVRVVTPGSSSLAPPGYYILFVVYREVPSQGIWVKVK
ncbi:hypothetical protein CASFOL_017005 [Castilleja foliolosa]|uniref:Aldehyde oxidase GLOX n=1 Tax=Castilleja foliolosa TaxID=1961234 RepID=A0ABD3DAA8_9LAMI